MSYKPEQKYMRNILSVHADSGMLRCITIQLEAKPDVLSFQESEALITLLEPTISAYLHMRCASLDKQLSQVEERK